MPQSGASGSEGRSKCKSARTGRFLRFGLAFLRVCVTSTQISFTCIAGPGIEMSQSL